MANIVQTAISAGSFKTLVKAVQAAGLVDTLSSPGPFTVFAPTDEAFARLPAGTLESLLSDVPRLRSVLTYHVLPGKMMAEELSNQKSLKTVQGQSVTISHGLLSRGVKIDNASVTKADLQVDNGVIHIIDKVILPK